MGEAKMKKPYTAQSDKLPHGAQWERENAYLYEDAGGKLIFSKIRYAARFKIGGQPVININTGKPRKKFEEVWPGHKTKPEYAPRMLYRLPELRRALFGKMRIFVVEGEAKVDLLIYKWKIAATCSEYGAGSWTDAHSEELRGAEVVILPDNDQAGRDHADEVGRSLINVAASVHLLELPGLPEHGDILDWVQAGGTKEQFVKLAEADRIWSAYGPPKPKAGKELRSNTSMTFRWNRSVGSGQTSSCTRRSTCSSAPRKPASPPSPYP
jgi:hypothetical protein